MHKPRSHSLPCFLLRQVRLETSSANRLGTEHAACTLVSTDHQSDLKRGSKQPRAYLPLFLRAWLASLNLTEFALVDEPVRAGITQAAVPKEEGRVRLDHQELMGATSHG